MRKLNDEAIAIAGICIIIFIVVLIVGGLLMWWIMNNLVTIGIGLSIIAIPITMMVVCGVLVKRYILEGGGDK